MGPNWLAERYEGVESCSKALEEGSQERDGGDCDDDVELDRDPDDVGD